MLLSSETVIQNAVLWAEPYEFFGDVVVICYTISQNIRISGGRLDHTGKHSDGGTFSGAVMSK